MRLNADTLGKGAIIFYLSMEISENDPIVRGSNTQGSEKIY